MRVRARAHPDRRRHDQLRAGRHRAADDRAGPPARSGSRGRSTSPAFDARGAWFDRAAEARRVDRRVSGRELQARRTRCATCWAFARWCRERDIAVVHTTRSLRRTSSACPAPRSPACRCASATAARSTPTRSRGANRAAARRLRAARTWSSPTRARPPTACARSACRRARSRSSRTASTSRRSGRRPASARRCARSSSSPTCAPEKGHDVLIDAAVEVLRAVSRRAVRDRRRRPRAATRCARAAPRAQVRARRSRSLGHQDDVAGAAGGGRPLRAAVAVRGVSERRARSDGRRPADRRVRRSAASSS